MNENKEYELLPNLPKDNVLAIKVRSGLGAQEKLRPIRTGSTIRHAQDTRAGVAKLKVLVLELFAVDRLATSAVVIREITALAHAARA